MLMRAPPRQDDPGLPKAVQRALAWTWGGMALEQVSRAFWPLLSLAAVGFSMARFGFGDSLSAPVLSGLLYGFGAVCFASLFYGLYHVRLPTKAAALTRLDSQHKGWPISAFQERQAIGAADPEAHALWSAHKQRLYEQLAHISPVRPRIRLHQHDPFALRYVAIVFFTTALIFGTHHPLGISDFLRPAGSKTASHLPDFEGWITPPEYTGLPTLYLTDQPQGGLEVPQGSKITLRNYGTEGVFQTVTKQPLTRNESTQTFVFTARQDGDIMIGAYEWNLRILPDTAPFVALTGAIETQANGAMALPYAMSDDYGVQSVQARISLDFTALSRQHGLKTPPDHAEDFITQLRIPVLRNADEYNEIWHDDFSQHPWANLPVQLQINVSDALDQTGASDILAQNLPGLRFFDPLAAALIEQRRDLLWARANARRVTQILRAIAHQPAGLFHHDSHVLRLQKVIKTLETAIAKAPLTTSVQEQAAQDLWDLAQDIEEGDLDDVQARLQRARARLKHAMREGASRAEIQRLMDELRRATEQHLQHRQQKEQQTEQDSQQNDTALNITPQDIQRMMDRIQNLMEQGQMAQAQEALEELQNMLDNLQMRRGQAPDSAGEQDGLSETLREQQELNDETFQEFQDQFNGFDFDADDQQGAQRRDQLAQRQKQLRQNLQNATPLPPQSSDGEETQNQLDEAARAMDDAAQALSQNDLNRAIERQGEAMQAMREAHRQLNTDESQGNSAAPSRDPLGRPDAQSQENPGSDAPLHDEEIYREVQDLLAEIRRRSAQGERTDEELNYLKRLLKNY